MQKIQKERDDLRFELDQKDKKILSLEAQIKELIEKNKPGNTGSQKSSKYNLDQCEEIIQEMTQIILENVPTHRLKSGIPAVRELLIPTQQILQLEGGTYDGEVLNGLPHGFGMLTFKNGDKYIGDFKKGYKDGYGKDRWSNGNTYEGQYVKNFRSGDGRFRWANGDWYFGQLENDERCGRGMHFYKMSMQMECGLYKNDLPVEFHELFKYTHAIDYSKR